MSFELNDYERDPEQNDIPSTRAESVFVTKLFFLTAERSAWYGTWSSSFFPSLAFHPTVDSAKREAEGHRVQGTQWQILEIPALAVRASSWTLLTTEINTQSPFKNNPLDEPEDLSLTDIRDSWDEQSQYLDDVHCFTHHPSWECECGALSGKHFQDKTCRNCGTSPEVDRGNPNASQPIVRFFPAEQPFTVHRSSSHGGNYYLSWKSVTSSRRFDPFHLFEFAGRLATHIENDQP